MASQRLLQRLPAAKQVGTARLDQYRLNFHMDHHGDSGKCNIAFTGNTEDFVHGVLYGINVQEKIRLDGFEGLGTHYDQKQVALVDENGRNISALTYHALITDARSVPFDWYRQHVLNGAIEHALAPEYIAMIEAIECKADHDHEREARELAIYQ